MEIVDDSMCVFWIGIHIGQGSPMTEFSMERGLRQGDPLALFLFLIVAEALNGLVKKIMEGGYLEAVAIDNEISFPILQYADDTIIICKST